MKLPKKKNKNTVLVVSLVVGALVIASALAFYFWMVKSADSEIENNQSTQQTSEQNGNQSIEAEKTPVDTSTSTPKTPEKEKDVTPAYEGTDVETSQSLTGAINYSAVAGPNLIIRTTINQTLSSGTCQLTLTNGSKTITRTSNIAPNPSSSTCEGFDIPTSELGSGIWKITIMLAGDGKNGTLTGSAQI